jgi:polyisoprenoid-binding protein YceI
MNTKPLYRLPTLGLIAMLLLLLGAPGARAERYVIDIEGMHASIQFRIRHLGYSWLTGRFNDFSGEFSFDPTHPEEARIEVDIETASIDSNHAKRDKHLRDEDFLYVSRYPQASFRSTRVEAVGDDRFRILGRLTLRGVTRDIAIDASRVGSGPDPWGGYRTGFTGTTRIALTDFGIDKFLGPASREVELILDIEGIRQTPPRSGKGR